MQAVLEQLTAELHGTGLAVRGWCVDQIVESEPQGDRDHAIVLIGNLGGVFWNTFSQSGFEHNHALDRWTKHVLDPIADKLNCRPLYPSDTPYQPFQRWAKKAEGLEASPHGILMHPEFGLWQAYRAAFVFSDIVEKPSPKTVDHACHSCSNKPCLTTCPVGAFSSAGYDVASCRDHVRAHPQGHCATKGCLARQACPVAVEHHYSDDQQRFHIDAFVKSSVT
ncbi:MAG: hypothetical protein ABJK39_08520 [Hyphomicrobiales bacterium]